MECLIISTCYGGGLISISIKLLAASSVLFVDVRVNVSLIHYEL